MKLKIEPPKMATNIDRPPFSRAPLMVHSLKYDYIYIWYPPKTYQFHKSTGIYSKICYFWYVILDSGIWGMLYSVYIHIYIYIEDSSLESNPCGNLGSWILNLAKNAFRMHSFGRIQDSRFKISEDSLEQILNPPPGFKIQDSRFAGKSPQEA